MKMSKEDAFEYLKGKKTMVINEEQSKEVQKKLFRAGFKWTNGEAKVCHADKPYLFTSDNGCITHHYSAEHFKDSESEFVFPFDILDIEIVEEKKESQFAYKQEVLVRDGDEEEWAPAQFAYINRTGTSYPYRIFGGEYFKQCIPYKGNEKLLGTTDNP